MKALQGVVPQWWTPPGETGPTPTRFRLRPLTGMEQYEVVCLSEPKENGDLRIPKEAAERAIRLAVVDVENMEGYDQTRPAIEQIRSWETIQALAVKIITDALLGNSEKKDYGSPQASPTTLPNSTANGAGGVAGVPPESAIPNGPKASGGEASPNG